MVRGWSAGSRRAKSRSVVDPSEHDAGAGRARRRRLASPPPRRRGSPAGRERPGCGAGGARRGARAGRALRGELAQIAPHGVLRDAELVDESRGDDLPVAGERAQGSPAAARRMRSCVVARSCMCMQVTARKPRGGRSSTAPASRGDVRWSWMGASLAAIGSHGAEPHASLCRAFSASKLMPSPRRLLGSRETARPSAAGDPATRASTRRAGRAGGGRRAAAAAGRAWRRAARRRRG